MSCEDPVGQDDGPQELPNLFDRVQLWPSGWQQDRGDVGGPDQLGAGVPPGFFQQEDGADAARDCRRLVEGLLHSLCTWVLRAGADVGEAEMLQQLAKLRS